MKRVLVLFVFVLFSAAVFAQETKPSPAEYLGISDSSLCSIYDHPPVSAAIDYEPPLPPVVTDFWLTPVPLDRVPKNCIRDTSDMLKQMLRPEWLPEDLKSVVEAKTAVIGVLQRDSKKSGEPYRPSKDYLLLRYEKEGCRFFIARDCYRMEIWAKLPQPVSIANEKELEAFAKQNIERFLNPAVMNQGKITFQSEIHEDSFRRCRLTRPDSKWLWSHVVFGHLGFETDGSYIRIWNGDPIMNEHWKVATRESLKNKRPTASRPVFVPGWFHR